jgi:hypothetical protein
MWTKYVHIFAVLMGLDFHEFCTFCGKNKKIFLGKIDVKNLRKVMPFIIMHHIRLLNPKQEL